MEPFYYSKMDRPRQAAYRAILTGLNSLEPSFLVPRMEGGELYDIFFQLRLDHPEIFWASGFSWKYYQDSPNVIFVPEYLFDKAKIRDHQKAMRARIEKLARPAKELTEWEKEKYIHDFICENIRYDKLKKPYSHEIIGPLGQGVGVCEGIAKSVKALCDELGIWCMIALCGSNPEKGIKYRHTWNIVRIGGNYYHLDATFDNTLGKTRRSRVTTILIWMIRRYSGTMSRSSLRRQRVRMGSIFIIRKKSCLLPKRKMSTNAPVRRQKKESS